MKQNYTEVVILHKKSSYFILCSNQNALSGYNANNWPWPKGANRPGSSRAAVKVHGEQ